ncbi:translation initiation factor IF-3 [Paenibacillus sacheonensis]|uniref:Translation initiation factor IF-3 n=1 Tax=Paenibacillus sacheonensis TaxID=742054 RepID=A0A7X4YV31_9BACL|nr:translation initiation factor IF-3 [Paenibacillus sacheonensis]MBM7568446.1 translation initiation factor IF-3 [Paenibacillus sacheonensis]NBC72144.1 translation initiation factor IF-3 [Paenibacillus sacheonensis]
MIINEQIKASEVRLTGIDGEDLGIVSRSEALALAKRHDVDLVCLSLMSSPPPCRLVSRSAAKQDRNAQKREEKRKAQTPKEKEIRLTPHIEDHDYDTKLRQIEKLLQSGHAALLTVRAQSKESQQAKALLERLVSDLKGKGSKETGIQVSGKGAAVKIIPSE